MNPHQRAVGEVLMLDLQRRASHLAPIDGTADHSPRADARLVIIRLRGRSDEGATVRATHAVRIELRAVATFATLAMSGSLQS